MNFLVEKVETTFLLAEISLVSQLFYWLTEVTVCKEYYVNLFAIKKLKEFLISEKESLNFGKTMISERNKFF